MAEPCSKELTNAEIAAVHTLEGLGYTFTGGTLWKPPRGPAPDFSLVAIKDVRIAALLDLLRDLLVECSTGQSTAWQRAKEAVRR